MWKSANYITHTPLILTEFFQKESLQGNCKLKEKDNDIFPVFFMFLLVLPSTGNSPQHQQFDLDFFGSPVTAPLRL